MASLEQHARSFILRCRSSSRLSCGYSLGANARSFRKRGLANSNLSRRTSAAATKPYYITSPIFYVNAAPHVGHLYTIVLTDILKRWHQFRGNKGATLLTGTDEHGMKIQKAAEKEKIDVKLLCDQNAQKFRHLANSANVEYTRFIRTTDEDHKEAVEHFWRELKHRGYIYESKHEGWYSVSDETFYPESQVHLVLDPSTGRKMHASMETGKEVEWTSETNYHFKLSAFKDRLLQHYEENPHFIVPKQRMNFIIKEVEEGLSDLSVSRPYSRLTWGVRVPDDDSQTIYVWLDALINYLTMTGYPWKTQTESKALWPPNCQVIGKDIVRFHCIYWPAFLMALDLPLPKQFLSHAHWTMNDAKMSKSLGNGVNPFYAMDRFGVDTIRYYMAHDGGIADDSNYENSYIADRYKKGLQGGYGNLMSRLVRGKKWSVRSAVEFASRESDRHPTILPESSVALQSSLTKLKSKVSKLMDDLNPRLALQTIMDTVYHTNKYFQDAALWDLVANTDEEAQKEVKRVLYLTAESLRITSLLLQPFMPAKSSQALDLLGVEKGNRTSSFADLGKDFEYGTPLIDVGRGYEGALFPPLSSEF